MPTFGSLGRVNVRIATAIAGLAMMLAAPLASAASVNITPVSSPTKATSVSFSFSANIDPGFSFVRFEGGLDGASDSVVSSPATYSGLSDGTHTFRVRVVQVDDLTGLEDVSGDSVETVVVDTTPPLLSGSLVPGSPNGGAGYYRSLRITWSCSDPGGSGVSACPDQVWTTLGRNLAASRTVTDGAGNSTTASTRPFSFDNLVSVVPSPASPGNNARLRSEPVFSWSSGFDGTSGNGFYEVEARNGSGGFTVIARVRHPDQTAVRGEGLPPGSTAPFAQQRTIQWRVVLIDRAGNRGNPSAARSFVLDTTVPPGPAITGGPTGPTNVSSPVFTWAGTGARYAWDITAAGSDIPLIQVGSTSLTQANPGVLADGGYVFRVSQFNAQGFESSDSQVGFSIDTVAPPAPVIQERPAFPTTATPTFRWEAEPGTTSRWRVLDNSDGLVVSFDSPETSAAVPGLSPSTYRFRVEQVDPAGNVSPPAIESFSVQGPSIASAPPPPVGVGPTKLTLPKANAGRLRPRAGQVLLTRRPVLRWKKGPPGTTLYNVQLFRVVRGKEVNSASVTKVHSVFPRGLRYEVPTTKTRSGTCYAWRVWPYVRNRFSAKPLGVSNFCIASAAALRKAARASNRSR